MLLNEDKRYNLIEVMCYFGLYDEAETEYINALNRPDLAIEMRGKIGDWIGVERLASEHGCEDRIMVEAWNGIAEQYYDRHEYKRAVKYFSKVN